MFFVHFWGGQGSTISSIFFFLIIFSYVIEDKRVNCQKALGNVSEEQAGCGGGVLGAVLVKRGWNC